MASKKARGVLWIGIGVAALLAVPIMMGLSVYGFVANSRGDIVDLPLDEAWCGPASRFGGTAIIMLRQDVALPRDVRAGLRVTDDQGRAIALETNEAFSTSGPRGSFVSVATFDIPESALIADGAEICVDATGLPAGIQPGDITVGPSAFGAFFVMLLRTCGLGIAALVVGGLAIWRGVGTLRAA